MLLIKKSLSANYSKISHPQKSNVLQKQHIYSHKQEWKITFQTGIHIFYKFLPSSSAYLNGSDVYSF